MRCPVARKFTRVLSQLPNLAAQLHQLPELIAGKRIAPRLSDER
jgi:hypothetical protein